MPAVHIHTKGPPSLAKAGDKEGPVIKAITEALTKLGAELKSAEQQETDNPLSPVYHLIVETSGVDQGDFQKAIQRAWPLGQTYGNDPIPQVESIYINLLD
ncbi:unnamed protein product [Penicillium pancosmium]